jgi:hypothetical protein
MTVIASIRCTRDMNVIVVKTQIAIHFFLIGWFSCLRFAVCVSSKQSITTQYIIGITNSVIYQNLPASGNHSQAAATQQAETSAKTLISKHRILNFGRSENEGCRQKSLILKHP